MRIWLPDALGSPATGSYRSPSTTYHGGMLYPGVFTRFAALQGLRRGRHRLPLGLAALGALAVIFVAPVASFVQDVLPGFQFSRGDRISIVFFLASAPLAAVGV